jgi:pimeloyl-ACP methyl ester carboxylesterase
MTPLPHPIRSLAQRAQLEFVPMVEGRIAWRRFGAGAPLVLLHGGHGSWLHWVRNIDALREAGHTVLVPDMPSFGDSDALAGDPHAPDRLGRLVDALDGSLDALLGHSDRIDVAGFSFGGLVAATWARRRPRFRRLALLGPAGHGSRRRPRAALQDWRLDDPAARRAALRHNLEAHMIAAPQRVDELALTVHEAACVATRFRSKELSLKASLHDALRGVDIPVLTIFGEHDVTATPPDAIASLAPMNPGWRCTIVPGAGHWVQFESAADVNRTLVDWFA